MVDRFFFDGTPLRIVEGTGCLKMVTDVFGPFVRYSDYEASLRAAVPEEEPVAWLCWGEKPGYWEEAKHFVTDRKLVEGRQNSPFWNVQPLYTHPAPRPDMERELAEARNHVAELELERERFATENLALAADKARLEPFERLVTARKTHVEAVETYNARLAVLKSMPIGGGNVDAEYRAVSDAQSEFIGLAQQLCDAALSGASIPAPADNDDLLWKMANEPDPDDHSDLTPEMAVKTIRLLKDALRKAILRPAPDKAEEREALEEAAKVVEGLTWFVQTSPERVRGRKPEEYAAAIRNLISNPAREGE